MSKKSRTSRPAVEQKPASPQRSAKLGGDIYAVLAIAAVWLIVALLVNPKGNFPLNDDWCYGRAAFDLVKLHEIHFVGITTMTLFAQALWGALFCLILGPTFTALRISTLTLGLMGLLAVYGILREIGAPKWAAFFGTLVVALNPLYLCLSYSFMTDVPFAAVALMAVYAYLKALRTDSAGMSALGTGLSVAAVLIRQFGLILPVGFAIAYVVKNGFSARSLVRAVVPIAVVALALFGFVQWMKSTYKLPALYNIQADSTGKFLKAGIATWGVGIHKVFVDCFVYLGGFLLPFLIPSFLRQRARLTARQAFINMCISAGAFITVISGLISSDMLMPLNHAEGDYLLNLALGPLTLRDVWIMRISNYPMASENFWAVVTVFCCIGGALLLWHLLAAVQLIFARCKGNDGVDKAGLTMLTALVLMSIMPLLPLTMFVYFDRYFIFAVPLLVGVVCMAAPLPVRPNRAALIVGIILLLLMGYFSVAGTHDYMAWNRLRWQAADELMQKGDVKPSEIEGGYEFNGWHNYRENDPSQGWWRDVYDDYVISFGPAYGYEVVRTYTFHRWMPPGEGTIMLLSKSVY